MPQDSAEALAMVFEAAGHESHVAFDGMQGVEQAKRYLPHIIFLDLDMPHLDGFGAARAIRASPDTDNPFIVALTAKVAPDLTEQTKAAGFDFSVAKPAETHALLSLVNRLEHEEHASTQQGHDS